MKNESIDIENSDGNLYAKVIDILGRVRLSKDINSTNFEIDLSQFHLENEVLFLKIEISV